MNGNRQFLFQQLIWIGISFGISIGLSLLLPFYISLPLTIAVFIGLSYYMRRRVMRRMNMSSGFFGGNSSLSYYCMVCGTKHNQASCPNCGSKMKKAGF